MKDLEKEILKWAQEWGIEENEYRYHELLAVFDNYQEEEITYFREATEVHAEITMSDGEYFCTNASVAYISQMFGKQGFADIEIMYENGKRRTLIFPASVKKITEVLEEDKDAKIRTLEKIASDSVNPAKEKEHTVYLVAGSVKRVFHRGTKQECLSTCDSFGWQYTDENEFGWDMELE